MVYLEGNIQGAPQADTAGDILKQLPAMYLAHRYMPLHDEDQSNKIPHRPAEHVGYGTMTFLGCATETTVKSTLLPVGAYAPFKAT